MERMRTIRKRILINASPDKVWRVLVDDALTPLWYGVFSRGSHPETDWREGSKAIFTDNSKTGLIARIIRKKVNELLFFEYEGIVMDGVEDYDSEHAHDIQGAHELYRLEEKSGSTALSVECDLGADFCDQMEASWEKALIKIRELSMSLNKKPFTR